MADTKISGLSAVTDVLTTDEFVLARSGTTKKITGANLASEIGGTGSGLAAAYDSVLGADAANFDVTSIPGTYAALMFTLTGRGATAANEVAVRLRMNNDSGSNYEYQRHFSHSGNNNNGSDGSSQTSIYIGELAAASATSGRVGSLRGEIHDYAGTTFHKLLLAQGGRVASIHLEEIITGSWFSTSAITRLTFFPASGDFLAGTRLTIWGLG